MLFIVYIPLGDRLATNYTKTCKVLRIEAADKPPPHSTLHVREPLIPAPELAYVERYTGSGAGSMHMLVWLFLSTLHTLLRRNPV
jgi:hypothetical protein